ncbi:flagellar hook-basal body complex protein [Terribacillus sp. DMT04]|uniref:flagellar hook-basal body complex protein n=1 Tax=Terribacillus sp. DMT04 TaxID=2850441 RepID=UPI001C2BB23E|nr:flagellar hook-basal body complex protein [Terribacillus sp. DMT04]QXE03102.1 flagellar hook-basal body complex protein [Terribacillus sp. DMT04]
MLRSLYSGISGMKGFQNNLDVVGNNIANVNSTGYKKSRIAFQDLMSQQIKAAQNPVENGAGGTNASQVGLGSKIGAIDNIHTQGNRQTTNRALDLALEGDGMFILSKDAQGNTINDEDVSFTRAGNFYLDGESRLVNSDGLFVLNTAGESITIPDGATQISINGTGEVTFTGAELPEDANANTYQIAVAKFSNPGGLIKQGGSTYRNTENAGLMLNDPDVDAGEGEPINGFKIPGSNGTADVVSGALEMSNVDLSEEFTNMIIAQRGFQANTRIITTSDQILEELVNLKR